MRALTAAPGAHGAGLQGRVEGRALEAPVADLLRRLPDGLDLGMVRGVGQALPAVAAPADHPAVDDDDRPDRSLVLGIGDAGEGEGLVHEGRVGGGEGHWL